jgi:hypothetical protein
MLRAAFTALVSLALASGVWAFDFSGVFLTHSSTTSKMITYEYRDGGLPHDGLAAFGKALTFINKDGIGDILIVAEDTRALALVSSERGVDAACLDTIGRALEMQWPEDTSAAAYLDAVAPNFWSLVGLCKRE